MMVCKVVEWQGRSLQSRSYEEVAFKLSNSTREESNIVVGRCETSSRRAGRTEQSSFLFLETRPWPRVATLPGKALARLTWLGESKSKD